MFNFLNICIYVHNWSEIETVRKLSVFNILLMCNATIVCNQYHAFKVIITSHRALKLQFQKAATGKETSELNVHRNIGN